jgi:RHS repeat-associated protein
VTLASKYTYAGTGFANPHAVSQIGNGLSTTTYAYDNNGNLASAGNGTATTTYTYDYANRLTALFSLISGTTTYGYDAFGARVYQITASSTAATSTYPFKFFSVASTTKSSTNYATSTEYVFNGDTLLSTVDQKIVNGAASGTAAVRYVHPDHLGSTNVVTDQNQNLVQTLDFYPYGATRVSVSTSTNEKRKFIGQFLDDSSLEYLQARYYEASRGQFLSQDPTFLAIGNPSNLEQLSKQSQQQFLMNPQQLNSYNYAKDNPIINKDPDGNFAFAVPLYYAAVTAPEWGPAVMAGVIGAGAYIAADMSLRSNGGLRWGGTVPTLDPTKMGFGPPPSGPEDWRPNLDNKPKWMKAVGIGGLVTMGTAELAQPVWDLYKSLTTRGTQAQQALNPQFNSSSVQTRYQATQSYNAASGASSPQQQLWVTPNGAVVNWNGGLVAPAPSNSSSNKKP